ncbi:hypothetical protein CIPAW_10G129100 [Carya illinoinensis]|uniref:Uncharacterized protein n=1 Tax=Carya illinoinensis TaxID=32201 RepID=A0A8T1PFB1_CARIL|nr:hypothetical protein CIPAW_10G129100 [Carya illinoinensis]
MAPKRPSQCKAEATSDASLSYLLVRVTLLVSNCPKNSSDFSSRKTSRSFLSFRKIKFFFPAKTVLLKPPLSLLPMVTKSKPAKRKIQSSKFQDKNLEKSFLFSFSFCFRPKLSC